MNYSYKTQYAALPENVNIAYIDEGTGAQTLLFVHGLGNYAMVWKKNIDELKQHYRCIAIDLPGNGLSDREEHPFGMKFYAECIYNFIHQLQLKRVCLVGHSMGGQIAIMVALNYPNCAEKLVLCAPAGFEEFSPFERSLFHSTTQMRDFFSSDESMMRHTIENSFFRQQKQGESVINELAELIKKYKPGYYKRMLDASIKGMLEETVAEVLQLIKQPTLIIFGTEDVLIPNKLLHHTTTAEIARNGAKHIRDARLVLVPDCGHFVQWEKADEVNEQITKFLA